MKVCQGLARLALGALIMTLASCGRGGPHATILTMRERELGGPPFPTRIIFNRHYVRIDPDTGTGNYILFNRKQGIIYSVDHGDHTILVIRRHIITLARPANLRETAKRGLAKGHFKGHKLRSYRLYTNNHQCYYILAAKGLLPGAVSALKAYAYTLAGEQARTVANTPPGLTTPCDLADNVFDPAREYAYGFPVRVLDYNENEKVLVGYKKDVLVKPSLFTLPAHYVLYSPGQIRNGS
ncbi:hypothetical protein [Acidiferrobacter sp.]|uniref:hypothetical protein n=1 Tax=Acidiferrobacter sp. TaxID=1872107 RepID=UPI00261357AC|nr:hypothetical protein [Acidiferrobacter sp.]